MRRPFPRYPGCPVCGEPEVNPATMAVRWSWDDSTGVVVARFLPDARHTGYASRVHGGILTALFDECLAWACAVACGSFCLTGELKVRFIAPAEIGQALDLRGWTVTSWGGYIRAEGEALSPHGAVVARAYGTYSALPREESLAMRMALATAPGDFDVLAERPGEKGS